MADQFKLNINENLVNLKSDKLYHLGFSTETHDFEKMFGDVKFVCLGATAHRMKTFAYFIKEQLHICLPVGTKLDNLSRDSHRYAFYKIGPIISVSHGLGNPSICVLLHELVKLIYYAKCEDPIFIRIGTSSGIGVDPGTVVITQDVYNSFGRKELEFAVLGKRVCRPVKLNQELKMEILKCAHPDDEFATILANTLSTNDFYEGQGRLDGAICEYNECNKSRYLNELIMKGIRNFEMEGIMLAAIATYTGIKAAIVCVTLNDRLKNDPVDIAGSELGKIPFEQRGLIIVSRYIKQALEHHGDANI